MPIRIASLVSVVFLMCGCGHKAYLFAAEDPTFSPTRTDPIWVTTRNDPSIVERQLLPLLMQELCRSGFNITTRETSKWTLGLSYDNFQYGSDFSRQGVRPNYENALQLKLFKTTALPIEDKDAVWSGTIFPNDSVLRAYRSIIFKPLLEHVGRNFDGGVRLKKSDLRNPGTCERDLSNSPLPDSQEVKEANRG